MTYKNHFEYGRLSTDENTFISQCGLMSRNAKSPKIEAIWAAQAIQRNAAGLKINLCLSGGIDSECMLEAFLAAHVEFEIFILKFKDDLNYFDIQTNLNKCRSLKLPYKIVELDIMHFFESGMCLQVAEKYNCQSPQLAVHLWFLEQLDGVPVLSGNPIAPIWLNDSWYFLGMPGELHCAYFNFFQTNQRQGVPWFFIYTPELIASFFALNCMQPYLQKNIKNPELYTYGEKCRSYFEGGFSAQPRADKFTGFELVKNAYDRQYNTKHGDAFNKLFRWPLEEMFPFPETYIQLVPSQYFLSSLE
ncbi:MAG: hypothetical protein H7061_08665 [Bdellovibrionaceae bacterium]|nr:hypothetical protein [Bdellovibrio sp.]